VYFCRLVAEYVTDAIRSLWTPPAGSVLMGAM